MRLRLLSVLVTAGLAVGSVAVAQPARADGTCTITGFSPRSVIVGLTPVTKTFSVSTSGCTVESWDVVDADYDFMADSDFSPQETFNPYSNAEAGAKDVIVTAYNSDYRSSERVFAGGFTLRRQTTWQTGSFNASPEPVKKGANVTLRGRLLVASWDKDTYVPAGGRTVRVQFRTPTGAYSTVKTVTAGADGWVTTTVPSTVTGVWRLSYAGSSTAGPAAAPGDTVQVV